MCDGVCNSRNFLMFLTKGVTASKFCQAELRWALQARKNIILVAETDDRHGKSSVDELIEKCPEDLKTVFQENVVIPWFRDPELRSVCITKILRKAALVDQEETSSTGKKITRALIFRNTHGHGDSDPGQVIDTSFVYFATFWGIMLPGSGWKTQRWAWLVRAFLVICASMCFSRLFHPEPSPSWFTYWDMLQSFILHFVFFGTLTMTIWVLHSDTVYDLVETKIEVSEVAAAHLRFKTRVLCGFLWLLNLACTVSGLWGVLPGFLHPYYMDSLTNDKPDSLFVFGISHFIAWLFVLEFTLGAYFATQVTLFVLQELCYMSLFTTMHRAEQRLQERRHRCHRLHWSAHPGGGKGPSSLPSCLLEGVAATETDADQAHHSLRFLLVLASCRCDLVRVESLPGV